MTPAALAVRHCLQADRRRAALVMNESVKEDFAELEEVADDAQAVIVGDLGPAFGYDVLNRAFRAVMDGAQLVALQKNRFWLTPDGLSLDVGPFVAALEYATGCHERCGWPIGPACKPRVWRPTAATTAGTDGMHRAARYSPASRQSATWRLGPTRRLDLTRS